MKHKGQKFQDQTIDMDFNQFAECEFIRCTLIYHGFGPIGIQGCSFIETRWTFSAAAANTISFMTALYSGAGQGGRELIERTLENIRAGRTPKTS